MEEVIFREPKVASVLKRIEVESRLHLDSGEHGESNRKLQLEISRTTALPAFALVDPATGEVRARSEGYQSAEDFAAFLEKAWK